MINILELTRDEILDLRPEDVKTKLAVDELFHIARMLGAFWSYDSIAAANGKIGLHAELKAGLHSNGFFVSKILLESDNICRIMAQQMVSRLRQRMARKIHYVAGVPDGATKLGTMVADILNVPKAKMEKIDGKIRLHTSLGSATILLVEDVCTRGTGFLEAVYDIRRMNQETDIVPYDPVILNRGGLETLQTAGGALYFKILPIVHQRIDDWSPENCPLCKLGSQAIKPKATEENWRLITQSQK